MPTIIELENSYVTIAEADSYLDELYLTDDWEQIEDDEKARLLIMATKTVERLPIIFPKYSEEQKLKFPVQIDGEAIGLDEAKEATIIQAWFLYRNYENILSAQDESLQNVKSQNLGAIQISKSTPGFNPFKKYAPDFLSTLSNYYEFKFKIGRG